MSADLEVTQDAKGDKDPREENSSEFACRRRDSATFEFRVFVLPTNFTKLEPSLLTGKLTRLRSFSLCNFYALVGNSVAAVMGKRLGVRHLQCILLFLAMLLGFCMRVNMSVGIVAMTDPNNTNTAWYDWSVGTQSVILSSFFWGYVFLQVPGGELARRFGGKLLITICIGVNGLITLFIPLGASLGGWQLICACRVVQGLTQGFLLPSTHNLLGKWAPLEEKSRLTTLIYAGCQLGTAIELMAAGFLSASAWGWPSIFYSLGVVSLLWCVLYVWLGSDSPQTSKIISKEERLYIQTSLGHVGETKKYSTPWRAIFTSLPFWSLIIVHCGQNWGFWTLLTEMPSYMKQVLGVEIQANGMMSALPYLAMYVLSFPLGHISDLAVRRKWVKVTTARKISNSIGHWGPAIALVGLCYAPAGNVTAAVIMLTVTVALNAGHFTGYLMVHIDMAPYFAGTLMGITNGIANLVSICAPLAVGLILRDETDASEWRTVFFLSAAIYIAGNLFFVLFGSCERQSWNDPVNGDINLESPSTKPLPDEKGKTGTNLKSSYYSSPSAPKSKKSSKSATLKPSPIRPPPMVMSTMPSSSVEFPFPRPATLYTATKVAVFVGILSL